MIKNNSWVEKYRPKQLKEVCSQENVISSLKNSLKTKNIPHLIFFGPSGCGKTSTILALSRELFGKEYWSDRIIELNASDERGINIVRDKIKTYAKHSIRKNDKIPPWKIIILDEADSMTSDSQFALRRIMEEYSKVTRFCIICNYHNKIIDPIVSRCTLFRFKPVPEKEILIKLKKIVECENMICSDDILKKIISICRGDMRKAVNFLQRCYNSFGDKINVDLLDEISGKLCDLDINKFFDYTFNNESDKVDDLVKEFYNSGYSLVNQILKFHDYILNNKKIATNKKALILNKLVEIDQNLIKGCDEYIQFLRFSYYIMSLN
jgi:replication factor C subunit 2/4